MEYPSGCYPRSFWQGMFNLTEAELNGRAFGKLGYGGTIRLGVCDCQEQPSLFSPFDPCGGGLLGFSNDPQAK